jgi:hypothetical protein
MWGCGLIGTQGLALSQAQGPPEMPGTLPLRACQAVNFVSWGATKQDRVGNENTSNY